MRGHRVYEKHVEVSFPWGKINHSQNECWNIVWFVHTYYSSVWQDCVGNAKSSVKCSRKTKKWRMFKSYIIAYICICVVVPKISGMLPWKCWGMRQKYFTLEKFFDFFSIFFFCWWFFYGFRGCFEAFFLQWTIVEKCLVSLEKNVFFLTGGASPPRPPQP